MYILGNYVRICMWECLQNGVPKTFFHLKKIGLGHSCGHPCFETSPCMYIMGMEYNKQILFDMGASKNVAHTSSFEITIAKAPKALRKHSPYSKGPM